MRLHHFRGVCLTPCLSNFLPELLGQREVTGQIAHGIDNQPEMKCLLANTSLPGKQEHKVSSNLDKLLDPFDGPVRDEIDDSTKLCEQSMPYSQTPTRAKSGGEGTFGTWRFAAGIFDVFLPMTTKNRQFFSPIERILASEC